MAALLEVLVTVSTVHRELRVDDGAVVRLREGAAAASGAGEAQATRSNEAAGGWSGWGRWRG